MDIKNSETCDKWLWRFKNYFEIDNNISYRGSGSTPTEKIETFKVKLSNWMRNAKFPTV